MIPIVILVIPVLAGIITLVSPRYRLNAGITLISGALEVVLAWLWNAEGTRVWNSPLIEQDGIAHFLLIVVTGVAFLSFAFALKYMEPLLTTKLQIRRFWGNINLFFGAICAVSLMSHLMIVWIAVELTTLMSILLVASDGTKAAIAAAWKYAILTLASSSIALFGLLLLYGSESHIGITAFTWHSLATSLHQFPTTPARIGLLFVLIGFGTKIGMVPLHTWLPDAYRHAPIPVCILFSGGEATVVVGVLLRLLFMADNIPHLDIGGWALAFGLLTLGVAAFLLVQVHDLKRMFAYSTMEQMGLILIAGSMSAGLAHEAALLQLLGNSFIKVACFCVAGSIITIYGTSTLSRIHGLAKSNTNIASYLALATCGILGLPPFMLFLGEFSIVRNGLDQHMWFLIVLILFFLIISFTAIIRAIAPLFSGTSSTIAQSYVHIQSQTEPYSSFVPAMGIIPSSVIVAALFLVGIGGFVLPSSIIHLIQSVKG